MMIEEVIKNGAIESYLFDRYNEVYNIAKLNAESGIMALCTDRQAALLGVTFDTQLMEEEEDE